MFKNQFGTLAWRSSVFLGFWRRFKKYLTLLRPIALAYNSSELRWRVSAFAKEVWRLDFVHLIGLFFICLYAVKEKWIIEINTFILVYTPNSVFFSQINDCLVSPLSDRLEEWRRTSNQMDRDYVKEIRKAKSELQRAMLEAEKCKKRLKRKVRHFLFFLSNIYIPMLVHRSASPP